jgi:hypothetical protein
VYCNKLPEFPTATRAGHYQAFAVGKLERSADPLRPGFVIADDLHKAYRVRLTTGDSAGDFSVFTSQIPCCTSRGKLAQARTDNMTSWRRAR